MLWPFESWTTACSVTLAPTRTVSFAGVTSTDATGPSGPTASLLPPHDSDATIGASIRRQTVLREACISPPCNQRATRELSVGAWSHTNRHPQGTRATLGTDSGVARIDGAGNASGKPCTSGP